MMCDGCLRETTHKFCPACGTDFYMSGIPYTPEVESIRQLYGVKAVDAIYNTIEGDPCFWSSKSYET